MGQQSCPTHRHTDKEINEQTDIEGSKTVLIKPGSPFYFVYMRGFVDLTENLQRILNQHQHHKKLLLIHFSCSKMDTVLELIRTASITALLKENWKVQAQCSRKYHGWVLRYICTVALLRLLAHAKEMLTSVKKLTCSSQWIILANKNNISKIVKCDLQFALILK